MFLFSQSFFRKTWKTAFASSAEQAPAWIDGAAGSSYTGLFLQPRRGTGMRIVSKGLLWLLVLCVPAAGHAAAESRTVFIIDATAQMSAKLGQLRKIDAVKSAVGGAAARMDPSASVALWAFGTSPSKKCESRSELVPLKPASAAADAIGKALGLIQPRAARTPVLDTLQAALAALGEPKDAPVSMIIITGTGDDCIGNICITAKRLHETYPNAKLTVAGIGMSEQAAANFTCAAKAMGGAFTAVKSGSDLDRTLRRALDIDQNAKPAKGSAPSSPAPALPSNKVSAGKSDDATTPAAATTPADERSREAQSVTKSAPPQQQQVEPNVLLSAAMADGSPPLEEGVTWEVFRINTTPTGQLRQAETPSWTGGGGKAAIKLAEGHYAVRVNYGYAAAASEITVGSGKAEKTIPLDAGTIAAEALQAPGQQAAAGVFFILYRRKSAAALEPVGRSSESPALFQVNAGDYVLSASAGLAKMETGVKVAAGKVSAVRMALNIGTVDIETVAPQGAPRSLPARHAIYAAGAQPGSPLLRIEGRSHQVQLPAGNYRIETILGNARVETPITVTPGQTVSQRIDIEAGEAKVTFAAGKPANICAVYDASAGRAAGPVGRAAGTEIDFILKAGVYDLECRPMNASAPAKQMQVSVVAGETKEAKFGE
jgi:hypothetical protein